MAVGLRDSTPEEEARNERERQLQAAGAYDGQKSVFDGGSVDVPGDWNNLRDNPISNFVFGEQQKEQPGVGGPAANPANLVQDPSTGMYYDPTTGTTYTDATGVVPVTNPNVAQQVASNFTKANAFLSTLQGLESERQAVNRQQNNLAGNFREIIAGNAPSVAAMQAQAGGQAAAAQQLAQVAGASGASAPLAGLMAARNTGQAMTGANNAGAIARVGEQKAAMDALNALLTSQGQGIERTAGRNTQAGHDFSSLALGGQESQQGLDVSVGAANAKDKKDLGGGVVKTVASWFGGDD